MPRYKAGSSLSLLFYLTSCLCPVAHGVSSQSCLFSRLLLSNSLLFSFVVNAEATVTWFSLELHRLEVLVQQSITMARTEKNGTDCYIWNQSVSPFIYSAPLRPFRSLYLGSSSLPRYILDISLLNVRLFHFNVYICCMISVFSDTDIK